MEELLSKTGHIATKNCGLMYPVSVSLLLDSGEPFGGRNC